MSCGYNFNDVQTFKLDITRTQTTQKKNTLGIIKYTFLSKIF